MSDVLDLGWLLLSYNMELNLCKTVFKALNSEDGSPYLLLEVRAPKQNLRSSDELNLIVPKHSAPFQDCRAMFQQPSQDHKNVRGESYPCTQMRRTLRSF